MASSTTFVTRKQRGASLLEFGIVVIIVAVLVVILLNRIQYYQAQAERAAVQMTVANIRTAIEIKVAQAKLPYSSLDLTMLAEENPLVWLKNKPANYAGEYFSPSDEDVGKGNWCYDRADKSLTYLLNFPESFLDARTKRLRFKVKLLRLLNNSSDASTTPGEVVGVTFEQVED